jgi:insulysin
MRMAFALFLALSIASIQAVEHKPYVEVEDKATLPLLSPTLKDRKKKKIVLQNGLEVIIVSDPSLEQSGAMLSVLAGSWYDPKDAPGIAHFLEHMLFLGTKKYPEEAGFQKFIGQHGGSHNAFTAGSHTSYFFTVDHDAFLPALDRFANFFIEPLLSSSGVGRELQAIDEEYRKNLEDDDRREYYLLKELFNPENREAHSAAGNAETLKHISPEEMRSWYNSFYSAGKMRIIIYSPLPIDELARAVVDDFSPIPEHATKQGSWSDEGSFIGSAFGGKIAYVEPVKPIRRLSLTWEVPKEFVLAKDTKPEEIVSTLLGHEGVGSLLAKLKEESLAQLLSAGMLQFGRDSAIFAIDIELTNKGVKERDKILQYVFEAIATYREETIPSRLFDEVKRIDTLRYQYQKPDSTFSKLVEEGHSIIQEDIETFPEKTAIIGKFDPAAIKKFFSSLTPQTAIIIVIAPEAMTAVSADKKEKEMGVPYSVREIPPPLLKTLEEAKPNPIFKIPAENIFIPQMTELVGTGEKWPQAGPIPVAISWQNSDKMQLFWAADTLFHLPKISWQIVFVTSHGGQISPEAAALTDLWILALKEALNSYTYPAKLAGLEYIIDSAAFGFRLTIDGYSDKAEELLKVIADKIQSFTVSDKQFAFYKEILMRDYLSSLKEMPILQARDFLRAVLFRYFLLDSQKASALRHISYDKFVAFSREFLDSHFIRAILYGNLDQNQVEKVATTLNAIPGEPFAKGKELHQEIILFPEKYGPCFMEKKIPVQGNAMILTIEAPEASFEQLAALRIFMQAIEAPFFEELRTVQQTGYIVSSSLRVAEGVGLAQFALQSATYNPKEMLQRVELFLDGYIKGLEEHHISEKDFAILKDSIAEQLKMAQQTPLAMSTILYELAFSYEGDFARVEKELAAIQKLEYSQFLVLAKELLSNNKHCRFVSAVTEAGKLPAPYKTIASPAALKKAAKYTHGSNAH